MNLHSIIKGILPKIKLESNGDELLFNELTSSKPSMIARFGSTEIKAIMYPALPFFVKPFLRKRITRNMEILSGFFPSNPETISRFSKLMIEDMKFTDVLGSWRTEEIFFRKYMKKAKFIPLRHLEPYFQKEPWTKALKDKNVLVIHPFNTSIEEQYSKRDKLFDESILPEFKSLQTIKAVQSIAGAKTKFETWFDALEYMKSEIDKKEFDIAIIGCGAYGFPLAAHVKRMGKKAFHLGGATQVLFGIKGKRWLEREDFKTIINEHFIFPMDEDKPKDAVKVEEGCYWQ